MTDKNKVVIRIHEARGLSAADFNGFSDPFVELRVKGDSTAFKTKGKFFNNLFLCLKFNLNQGKQNLYEV